MNDEHVQCRVGRLHGAETVSPDVLLPCGESTGREQLCLTLQEW